MLSNQKSARFSLCTSLYNKTKGLEHRSGFCVDAKQTGAAVVLPAAWNVQKGGSH